MEPPGSIIYGWFDAFVMIRQNTDSGNIAALTSLCHTACVRLFSLGSRKD